MHEQDDQGGRRRAEGVRSRGRSRRSRLSPEQQARLAERLQRARSIAGESAEESAPEIPRRPDLGAPVPLSYSQERLWFLEHMGVVGSAFNMLSALRFEGDLQLRALEAAQRHLLARFEILRVRFAEGDDGPVQIVEAPGPWRCPVIDLSGLDAAERQRETEVLLAADWRRPFDLYRSPLMRASVVRLGPQEHIAILATHHIASDGWSAQVLYRELAHLYQDCVAGRAPTLPPLAVHYPDFAVWQRRRFAEGEELERHLSYWKPRLLGAPVLDLPTDHPRPPVRRPEARYREDRLDAGITAAVRNLARRGDATLFMVLLTAWKIVLRDVGRQADITVGTFTANRTLEVLEGQIGFFVNNLALRTNLGEGGQGLTFTQALERVKEVAAGAFAHQDLPFEKVLEAVQPERRMSHTPLFQVLFVVQNAEALAGQVFELPGLRFQPMEVGRPFADFDITLAVFEEAEELRLQFAYDGTLFDSTTMERWSDRYRALLTAALAAPQRPLGELSLLPAAERHQLLHEWGLGEGEPYVSTVAHWFAAAVTAYPEAPALVADGQTLSYRELARRAGVLARRLRAEGVGPDHLVGLCAERSAEMAVAMVAILQAGGAYVPLDPAYPAARLRHMVEDADLRVLVTAGSAAATPELLDLPVPVRIDAAAVVAQEEGGEPFPSVPADLHPHHLAYVIYTSGSTGRPKGVALHHGTLVNLLGWHRRTLLGGVRTLQYASLSFDASFHEMFAAWGSGGTVYLVPEGVRRDVPALARFLESERIAKVILPVVVLQQLAEWARGSAEAASLALQEVTTTGEQLKLNPAVVDVFRGPLAGVPLHNHYGPSETHVVTAETLRGDPAAWPGVPTIGRPLPACRVLILDPHGRPAPVGVPGEMLLAGVEDLCLARGYYRRPALTAERFQPDPLAQEPGARAYRSGDLARFRSDGRIDFLGRIDHQVKIRGFRIEPEEVEVALVEHPALRRVVVVPWRAPEGDLRLVAYIVCREAQPEATALRSFLNRSVPDYMVPAIFVPLDEIPLNANGKVDRKALPEPVVGDGVAYVAPRTDLERGVAKVFAEVLGRSVVGLHDDFFALGGHSLLATQVVTRLRRAFGRELPLPQLFAAATVEGVAVSLAVVTDEEEQSVALEPRPDPAGPAPLSFAQQRLWFLDRLEPGSPAYHVPLTLHMEGPLHVAALSAALGGVVARHEALRTTFRTTFRSAEDGVDEVMVEARQWVVAADGARSVSLPVVDLSGLAGTAGAGVQGQAVAALAEREAVLPFDLETGPLMRGLLLRLTSDAPDHHLLFLNLHHIVTDGWSMGVLVREAAVLYREHEGDFAADLPPLPVQYADFALWQRQRLAGAELERLTGYWKGIFSPPPDPLALPLDRPRPARQTYRGATLTAFLGRSTTAAVEAVAQQLGATPFMVLLAAYLTLLSRLSGQREVTLGTPVANRTRVELEGLIGFFANTLALRVKTAGDPPFATLVQRVKECALGAFEHQDLPFERVVEAVQPRRDPRHSPLFQAMLVLENAPVEPLEAGDLRLRPADLDSGTAKFDQTLLLFEAPGEEGILTAALEYNTDLFDTATARRTLGAFERMLSAAVTAPATPLSQLPLLSTTEHHQVVVEWGESGAALTGAVQTSSAEPGRLDDLFLAQARRTPAAVAVLAQEAQSPNAQFPNTLSYGELAVASAAVAEELRRRGVEPGARVAVAVGREPRLTAAVLGVLRAGAAYVPLDPAYPAERLAFMVADSGVAGVVTTTAVAEEIALPPSAGGWRWSLPPLTELVAQGTQSGRAFETLVPAASPDALAYLLYTSGSTGRPKGVAMAHRAVVHLMHWQYTVSTPSSADGSALRTLAFSALSFDVSCQEMFSTWAVGGTLVLVSEVVRRDAALLLDFLESMAVERLFLPFVALEALAVAATVRPRSLVLRAVITAGEQLRLEGPLRRWLADTGAVLHNHYGPTETHIVTAWSAAAEELSAAPSLPPIGRPVAGVLAWVAEPGLVSPQPAPVGVVGELLLGGVALAWGYHGRPRETALAFVPDPFGAPGSRLYRTGDLARWDRDGDLHFLGRRDTQVKVRGFRVEPGEIEAVLGSHSRVTAAAVVPRPDAPGGPGLVTYITLSEGTPSETAAPETGAPEPGEVRAFLAERLPDFLVPAAVVVLPTLPLSPSGKVDRRALQDLEAPGGEDGGGDAAPVLARTAVEAQLADIWSEVLGRETISVEADFFSLGGHSLLATRVLARVARSLGAEVPLQDFFDHPTVEGLAARIEGQRGEASLPPLVPQDSDGDVPLSFAQERLWFLDQLQSDTPAYNLPIALKLRGVLDVRRLALAFATLVSRHDALRTTFQARGGKPRQVIATPTSTAASGASVPLPVIDLSSLPPAIIPQVSRRLTEAEGHLPFDLVDGPLLRTVLLRRGAQDHTLLITLHHIVADGWSLGVLVSEVTAAYRGEVLPPLPVQYADFAIWQRSWLRGEVLEAQLDTWRRALEGAPPVLELPLDRPRPLRPSYRGEQRVRILPSALTAAVHRWAQAEGATPFMIFHTALAVLLARLAGTRDVVLGTPIANRVRVEVEGLIGFFVNTLVLRARLEPRDSGRTLVDRVRRVALEAYAHQDLPFERLVEELEVERSLNVSPLFQVLLVLQNTPQQAVELPGLELLPPDSDEGGGAVAKVDWTVEVAEDDDAFRVALRYRADLFTAVTAERTLERLETLLTALLEDPGQPIETLPLLLPAEREQLARWNDTAVLDSAERIGGVPGGGDLGGWIGTVPGALARQVAARPDAPALPGLAPRNFAAFQREVRLAARVLQARGVGVETPVALLLPRIPQTILALFAVFEAGATAVPLDPRQPGVRNRRILEDCGAHLCLVAGSPAGYDSADGFEAGSEDRLGSWSGAVLDLVELLGTDTDTDIISGTNTETAEVNGSAPFAPPALAPDHLAYILYTSGSTGVPKGVMVSHGAILNLVAALETVVYAPWAEKKAEKRVPPGAVAINAPLAFDASVKQWAQLLAGRPVVMVPEVERLTPERLLPWLEEWGIRSLDCTPTLLEELLAAGLGARRLHLLVGGEALSADLWRRLAASSLAATNVYGPTETTVDATAIKVRSGIDFGATGRPPIGAPLRNVRLTVVDLWNGAPRPLPPGVFGELGIAGHGLARGYLGRPALTAERFRPHPDSQVSGDRLYLTGDRARWRSDGQIELAGRLDHQIKIRGVRIELGEIEAVLHRQPGVRKAAVLLRPAPAAARGETLVAYIAAAADSPDAVTLAQALRQDLPAAMVPGHFAFPPRLPRNANGKLDRRALAELPLESGNSTKAAPLKSSTQEMVAAVWREVLELSAEAVGADSHFFTLGGHSLLATQVASRLEAALGQSVELRWLFERPILADLAAALERQAVKEEGVPDAIPRVLRPPHLPLSHAQERLWFLDQLVPGSSAYNLPMALRLLGALEVATLDRALATVVERHEALRTIFRESEGEPSQEMCALDDVLADGLPVIDLSALAPVVAEREAAALASREAVDPFDLAAGPLHRQRLLRLPRCPSTGREEHQLLITEHHIVSDGWSAGVLLREVVSLYRGELLPPLPLQYADFALWQRGWLQGEALKRQVDYWRGQLTGAPEASELPTDRSRPPLQSSDGALLLHPLGAAARAAMDALTRGERGGTTPFMVLLAALATLLSRHSGQRDLVLGAPVANRHRREVEGLMGFFVNNLVLRLSLVDDPSWETFLQQVREAALGAYAHQDLPFEKLVDALVIERDLSRSPLFQVALAVQGAPPLPQLPGLDFEVLDSAEAVAKFDLTLTLAQNPEGPTLAAEYAVDLFDATTVERFLMQLERILVSAATLPRQRVLTLPLLSAGECHQLVWEHNDSVPPRHRLVGEDLPRTFPDLFARTARRQPTAVALALASSDNLASAGNPGEGKAGEKAVTYGELNALADRLAHRLRTELPLAAGPEVWVGVLMESSPQWVVAFLAIQRAGGVYLPLDPGLPEDRLRFLVEDAGAVLVLTAGETVGRGPTAVPEVEVTAEEVDPALLVGGSQPLSTLPLPSVEPEALAYVIYTSGSTGTPKGVALHHAGFTNLVLGQVPFFGLVPEDRMLQFAALSFDASVWELGLALGSGATLVLPPNRAARLPGGDLEALLEEQQITASFLPPAILGALRQDRGGLGPVKKLFVGGEACSAELVDRWSEGRAFFNAYGPTEATVCATAQRCLSGMGLPPIGRPQSGYATHIVDPWLQPLPLGAVGELVIGGTGVARGYLGRPALTAAHFVPDPFATTSGARLYRTGDQARRRSDGRLDFLGRFDHQVKVRGYRIELGEIEAVVRAAPGVQGCAVLVLADGGGDERLVAYVTLEKGPAPATAEPLRSFCAERLPEYMVPSVFQVLDSFPLSPAGKIDRRRLLQLDGLSQLEDPAAPAHGTPPRTSLEAELALLWEDLLGSPPAGIESHFFHSGGHSLLAVRLIARLREKVGFDLPLRVLFEAPTIAALAAAVEALREVRLPVGNSASADGEPDEELEEFEI
ncbi:MAG: amino acid adenylation domain-containing protein [Acidobacteriota bacterium]